MLIGMTATRPVTPGLLPHLRRARDHIDRHYEAARDLVELASVAVVSKFHFVRSFEATYGETPMRLLTRRRIERALVAKDDPGRPSGTAGQVHVRRRSSSACSAGLAVSASAR